MEKKTCYRRTEGWTDTLSNMGVWESFVQGHTNLKIVRRPYISPVKKPSKLTKILKDNDKDNKNGHVSAYFMLKMHTK